MHVPTGGSSAAGGPIDLALHLSAQRRLAFDTSVPFALFLAAGVLSGRAAAWSDRWCLVATATESRIPYAIQPVDIVFRGERCDGA